MTTQAHKVACVGLGVCIPRNNCGYCTPAGSPRCQQCGCDGRTYASIQEACVAGVRVAAPGACGGVKNDTQNIPDASVPRFNCGRDEQCPDGKKCCALVGECFDPVESWRCEEASNGGVLDCLQDNECVQLYVTRYCDGAGCPWSTYRAVRDLCDESDGPSFAVTEVSGDGTLPPLIVPHDDDVPF